MSGFMFNPQLNQLAQAAAASMFKGGELQKERDAKAEKAKQMCFVLFKEEAVEETHKANNADQGRFA